MDAKQDKVVLAQHESKFVYAKAVAKMQSLEEQSKKMEKVLEGLKKFSARFDGQQSVPSFETAGLLRELRQLARDASVANVPAEEQTASSSSAAPGAAAVTGGTTSSEHTWSRVETCLCTAWERGISWKWCTFREGRLVGFVNELRRVT